MDTPTSSPKTRCRPIAEGDLGALADLLARGFPRVSRARWTLGLAHMAALPEVEDMPRFGYLLESGKDIVGVLLVISSRRGARIIANLSSWYVDPEFRSHATLLVGMATRMKDVTYINISPAPHTIALIEALGFTRYNDGRSAIAAALVPGGGRVSETIPGDLAERDLLLAHRDYGCASVMCGTSPFVFKPRTLRFLGLRMMELIYCRGTEDFAAHAGALGRHFLRRGVAGLLCDGRVSGLPAYYSPGKEPRYFKGPAPILFDLAFTEEVIIAP